LKGLGQGPEAERHYRQDLALREKLAADAPAVPDYRQDLAASHHNLGVLLAGLGKRPEAEAQYLGALALYEKLAADAPAVPQYRRNLAMSHNSLGLLLSHLGKLAEAKAQFRRALALQEKLAADFPAVPQYQIDLGGNACNLAHLVREGGRPGDSLEWYDKAIRTLTAVYDQDRRLVEAKQLLRNSHYGRAMAYYRVKKYAEAVRDWDRVIELSPKEEQPAYRIGRAIAWARAGREAEAVAVVEEFLKLRGLPAKVLYDFAGIYAVASARIADKQRQYADRAVALLRQAAKAGFTDATHMKKDTTFSPLRDRADFRELIAGLEKKSQGQPEKQP
jgi:tetratricopeptide (TPR) repeat protein